MLSLCLRAIKYNWLMSATEGLKLPAAIFWLYEKRGELTFARIQNVFHFCLLIRIFEYFTHWLAKFYRILNSFKLSRIRGNGNGPGSLSFGCSFAFGWAGGGAVLPAPMSLVVLCLLQFRNFSKITKEGAKLIKIDKRVLQIWLIRRFYGKKGDNFFGKNIMLKIK